LGDVVLTIEMIGAFFMLEMMNNIQFDLLLMDMELFFYIGGVTLVAIVIYVWVNMRVSSYKEGRVSRIKNLVVKDPETIAPMPTDILSAKETKRQEKKIIKGVRSRFTVIQRRAGQNWHGKNGITSLKESQSLFTVMNFLGLSPKTKTPHDKRCGVLVLG
jgi:hypothetical protein